MAAGALGFRLSPTSIPRKGAHLPSQLPRSDALARMCSVQQCRVPNTAATAPWGRPCQPAAARRQACAPLAAMTDSGSSNKASGSGPPAAAAAADAGEPARRNLQTAADAMRRFGWISFWAQLCLSVVSCILFAFSVAFSPAPSGPSVSLYLTLFGVVAGLFSTFWAFGYVRLNRKLRAYLAAGPGADVPRIRKVDVLATLQRGAWINMLGLGSTLVGLQATVGLLVAKTLTNATANPFLSSGSGAYNPVLALDVFLVQASTNTLLSHFVSLFFALWLSRIISRGAGQPAGQVPAFS